MIRSCSRWSNLAPFAAALYLSTIACTQAEPSDKSASALERGAGLYFERCTLCHGDDGMGEGVLAISVPDYPDTTLLNPRHATNPTSIRDSIVWGGANGDMHEYSPPWVDELSPADIGSLTLFVSHLREDTDRAIAMIQKHSRNAEPSLKVGNGLYQTRCATCHGKTGAGDGRMARVITDPPPFNLNQSRASDEELSKIIGEGGAAVGRSPKMPPWQGELSPWELRSVVMYLKTLRR